MKSHALIAALFLPTGVAPAVAQTAHPLAGQIDAIFEEWNRSDSPGCAVGVANADDLVFSAGYGSANLETGDPLASDDVFYMASVSKQFTAGALALLAKQGRLSLDDPVRQYIPELPAYARNVTIRHLVHHTSGLRDYLSLMTMADMPFDESYRAEEVLDLIVRQRAGNFLPGDEYTYSNTGYFLIPVIVERVTQMSFRDFTTRYFFEPLGMRSTRFHDDHRRPVENRVISYGPGEEGGFERTFLDKFDQVGSGGLLSTVEDMVKWNQNFSEPTAGGPEWIETMLTRGILNSGDTLDYAFGLTISEFKGLPVVEHGGSMMGFKTHLLRFPKQRMAVITLCNLGSIDPGVLSRRVAGVFLEREMARELSDYAGTYTSDELGVTWRFAVQEADLAVDRPEGQTSTLEYRSPDTFRLSGGGVDVVLTRDTTGRVDGFLLNGGRARGIRFERGGARGTSGH